MLFSLIQKQSQKLEIIMRIDILSLISSVNSDKMEETEMKKR